MRKKEVLLCQLAVLNVQECMLILSIVLICSNCLKLLLTSSILSLISKIFTFSHFQQLFFVKSGQVIPLTNPFLKPLLGRNLMVSKYARIAR